MNTIKYAGIKRSNFDDFNGSLKRQKLNIDNISNFDDLNGSLKHQKLNLDNMSYQIYKMKCSIINSYIYNNMATTQLDLHKNNIESNTNNNINIDNNFLNNDNSIKMISNNEDIESALSVNNSKYEQINSTLRNLHNYRKLLKNNFDKDQNNSTIKNNIPIYNNFYSKINSQLKTIHISNMKLHKRDYLN